MSLIPGGPEPPFDAIMPQVQMPLTIVFGVLAVGAGLYSLNAARLSKSWFPVAVFVGSALSMFCEPAVTALGHNWYPAVGSISIFEIYGHTIPLFVGFAYCFYFAPGIIYMVNRLESGLSRPGFWALILGMALFVTVYDYVGLGLGLWMYYGDSPLTVYGFPLWWITSNLMVFIPASVILFLAKPYLKGGRVWLVVPFMATQVVAFHSLASLPAFTVLNMRASEGIRLAGVLITIALGLLFIWICGEIGCRGLAARKVIAGELRAT